MNIILLFFVCFICFSRSQVWNPEKYKFPKDFLFGVATSAYQIEGAFNEDGKGESIWDHFLHNNHDHKAGETPGDLACDSYHQYQRDVEMLRELGVDFYRFSVSWARVLPSGFSNQINEQGLQYYKNLTAELIKYNIEPMITMYHYDLPQALQDLGGWANPSIQHWFADYARVLYDNLPQVKYWVTLNQPSVCFEMYGGADMAPKLDLKGVGDYLCLKNMLLAHARAYRIFEKEYRKTNKSSAQVGIALALNWADPLEHNNKDEEIVAATQQFRDFTIDLYVHPIFSSSGDFPQSVKEVVARNSKREGYPRSRLPQLNPDEVTMLKGSADFLGMNHYTTMFISPRDPLKRVVYPEYPLDIGDVELGQGSSWAQAKSPWLKSAPYGIYHTSLYISQKYNNPPTIITEHGWSTDPGLEDVGRINSIREYMKALSYAIFDQVNVKGIAIWSLMDNVEWVAGTRERFGLYEVDFNSTAKTRTPRLSAHFYRSVIHTRLVRDDWKPSLKNINKMAISKRRIAQKKPKTDEL